MSFKFLCPDLYFQNSVSTHNINLWDYEWVKLFCQTAEKTQSSTLNSLITYSFIENTLTANFELLIFNK